MTLKSDRIDGSGKAAAPGLPRRSLLIAGALGAAAVAAPGPALAARELKYRDFPGDFGRESVPCAYLATDAAKWRAVWARVEGVDPDEKLPYELGEDEIGVGVFAGTRPTGGYTLVVRRAYEDSSAIVVEVEERPPNAFVNEVVTSPYILVAVTLRKKPANLNDLEVAVMSRMTPKSPPGA